MKPLKLGLSGIAFLLLLPGGQSAQHTAIEAYALVPG